MLDNSPEVYWILVWYVYPPFEVVPVKDVSLVTSAVVTKEFVMLPMSQSLARL